MEIILLLCSSGVAGLYTFIYLDYLSIFDTEKKDIKKMFNILFSLLSVSTYSIISTITKYFINSNILNVLIALIVTLIVVHYLTKYIYIRIIHVFRENMNKKRSNLHLSKLSYKHPIDEVLDTEDYKFYIEYYNAENSEPITTGELIYHSVDENDEINFIIAPTPKIKDTKIIDDIFVYQKSNNANYYKIYSKKINQ